jgi:membrane-associated protease RseP (regulator of RpoE activity)
MSDPIPSVSSTTDFYRPVEVFVVHPYRQRYWIHILLLLATIFTTLVVGARMEFNFLNNQPNFTVGNEFVPFFQVGWALSHPARLLLGIPFSATLLLILFAHEMGHYLYCRYYHVQATLPFFIPAPTLIGTLGAVIRIRSPIRSRAALFDIGIAGPIAGFVVAIATLFAALVLSKPASVVTVQPDLELGFPLIFRVAHSIMATLAPNSSAALPLHAVLFHPIAVAAWVGMFATAMNLLPSGQLDGGHIVYALLPRAHRWISWMTILFLVYLGWHYAGWRVWAALITGMNILSWRQRQAPDFPGIGGGRRWLAAVALIMLVLTFAPVPFHNPEIGWR